MCDRGLEILVWVIALNTALSALHFLLSKIKDRTHSQVDDRLDDIVSFLLTMLNWLMANRGRGG